MRIRIAFLFAMMVIAVIASAQKFDKRQAFIDGNKQIQIKQYKAALDIFLQFEKNGVSTANTDWLTGYCYFQLSDTKKEAIPYLEKSVVSINPAYKEGVLKENAASPKAFYLLGQAYYRNYKFTEALTAFEKYRDYVKNEPGEIVMLDNWVKYSVNAENLLKTPVDIKIYNLGNEVNSDMDDHSAVFNVDETVMVLTSRRKGSTGNLKTTDGQYFEDIYISYKKDGKWTVPVQISENINSMEHEASIALSPDGKELFIYKDELGDGNIYVSNFDGTNWSKPVKLGSNINSLYNESHATISPDGQTLYFSSNRPDGYGGFDLYAVSRLPNGEWGWAQNLGTTVNTPYDETGPYMQFDGTTLYFSSKGFNSMGGYDLFYTILKDDGTFTRPDNMGYPVNSINDDVFYVLSADGKRAYYSTKKEDSYGGRDIYLMDLMSLPERSLVVINGYIKNANGEIVKDIVLNFKDSKTGKNIGDFKPNASTGKYTIVVPKSMNSYRISDVDGKVNFVSVDVNIPENSSFYLLQKPIIIDPIAITK